MSGELIQLGDVFGALSTQSAADLEKLDSLSTAVAFLPRIQLYSRGKAIDLDRIAKGHFGVPLQGDEIKDLGQSIDLLVLVRKAKAIDMSDTDNIIVSNDMESEEFQRIMHAADNVKDSGCAWGPTYLVYERTSGKFYEFFCGNKSARYETGKINTYLPVTEVMIAKGLTDEKEPRGPKPMTLSSTVIEKGRWTWHAPVASDCLTPFDKLPTRDQIVAEIEKFLKKDEAEVEVVQERGTGRKR